MEDNCKNKFHEINKKLVEIKLDVEVGKQQSKTFDKSIDEIKHSINDLYSMIDNKVSKLIYWMLGTAGALIISAVGVILAIVLKK